MTEGREYKVTVLDYADKDTMMKECYRLDEMLCDEWLVHDECNSIDEKLEKINEWKRKISRVENGYKNRRR